MHSDRELLELAAKAAGLQLCGYSWIGENEDDEECEILDAAFVKNSPEQDVATMWNPLTDDGDALRLAVKLSIHIRLWIYACEAEDNDGRSTGMIHASDCGGDVGAATRRAIVRAAAAIGEAM